MSGFIGVKDFEEFQHYKGRTPPWIKFYNTLLDDYRFLQLSDAARSQLMLIWLVASRHRNRIPNDEKYIAQAIHCTTKLRLAELLESKWLYLADEAPLAERTQVASKPQANRPQLARPEGEVEKEVERDKEGEGDNGTSPPRIVLPTEANRFLNLFYEGPAMTEAARKRYADVKKQLYDVLDPLHPGVVIRGGVRSKARSVEHLIDELNAVMKNPPPDRDLAIVWLLKRLMNAPKGPSVTEKHHREQASLRELEERYQQAAKQAGIRWATEHPVEYNPIAKEVDAAYAGKSGGVYDIAKQSMLTQRCSKACGFPSYEEWAAQQSHQVSAA